MSTTRKSKVTKLVMLLLSLMMVVSTSFLLVSPTRAESSYSMTWVGTSAAFSGTNKQSAQEFIQAAVVQDDGTIWTVSYWSEGNDAYADYKDGVVYPGPNPGENRHNLNANSSRVVQDYDGRTWSIQNATFTGGDKVCREGSDICIGPIYGFRPNALAIANDGTLMIGDNGVDQQIKFYNISGDSTEPVRTFGVQGGAWAGPEPGRTGPLRFHGIWGVGQDNDGNIYVIGNFPGGGSWFRSLQEDGTLNWQRYGKIFVGNTVPDMSTDGTVAYDQGAIYHLDYNQTEPGQLTEGDFPYAVTVNPWTNPNDPRLRTEDNGKFDRDANIETGYDYKGFIPRWVHDCQGRKYLFTIGMFGGRVSVYVQNGNFWEERDYINGPSGDWPWASYIDSNCDVWLASGDGYVSQYPVNGVDGDGNLTYGDVIEYPRITAFNDVMRLYYDRDNDLLYVSGFTDDRPRNFGWGESGSVFKRYSNWKGNRQETLNIDLPYNMVRNSDGSENGGASVWVAEWDIAGDYVFLGFGSRSDVYSEHTTPSIFSLNDGSYVTTLRVTDPIVSNDTGWIDVRGLVAGKRSNGEYIIFIEEDWKNKVIVYRWWP